MILTEPEVRERLRAAVAAAGSQRAYARRVGCSNAYISMVIAGITPPGQIVLDALGLRRTTPLYEEVKLAAPYVRRGRAA